jgi:group I intron endonuclease
MKYIYLITSPSGKQYIGKSTIDPTQKSILYQSASKYFLEIKRPILEAIRKYGWDNMRFTIVEQNNNWSSDELNQREKYWIQHYKTLHNGYNVTAGGDGHDSDSAKIFWQNVSEEWKKKRAINCSSAQKRRYKNAKDSVETKKRKSDSHKGTYKIVSPDGREWITALGLKEFAEVHKDEIKISYWGLFSAYRKCYNNIEIVVKRKNENLWKVTRVD